MTKVFCILALLTVLWTTVPGQAQPPPQPFCTGTVEGIYSRVLHEQRTFWVHLPATADRNQRFPVLYLLDGESHFAGTVGMVQQLAGRWPDLIVVGIVNTARNRDLTPTHVAPSSLVDPNYAAVSGGGEKFMQFIGSELIPRIDSLYPTTPYRILSGHSLGGLTVVNTLAQHPDLFSAYLSIDPSLWWDQQQVLRTAETALATKKFAHKSLFIGISKPLLPPGMDTASAQHDGSDYTVLFRSVTHLTNTLRGVPANALRWRSTYYPDEQHGTVELLGQYDGLKFLFDEYSFRASKFTFQPNVDLDSAVTAHFAHVSQLMGYQVLPGEQLINNLGYTYLSRKQPQKAYAFFKRNVDNYPRSANAYDSLGDFYAQQGNKRQAIAAYTEALELQEIPDTRRKLTALQARR